MTAFLVSVNVSKGSRSASKSITLSVVEGNPPAVWAGQSKKVKASERVELEGYYITSIEPTKVEWSSSTEQGMLEVFLLNHLTVKSLNWPCSKQAGDWVRTYFFLVRIFSID